MTNCQNYTKLHFLAKIRFFCGKTVISSKMSLGLDKNLFRQYNAPQENNDKRGVAFAAKIK